MSQTTHPVPERLVRHEPLTLLSASLSEGEFHQVAGLPSCIAVHPKLIAVGSSRGFVFVYDHFQGLVATLPSPVDRGSVTCIDFLPSGEWLAAGYQWGGVTLFDILNRRAVKSTGGKTAQPATSVIRFLGARNGFLVASVKGKVDVVHWNKVLGFYTLEWFPVLDGTVLGPVLALAPLVPSTPHHPVYDVTPIAFSAAHMTYICALAPKQRVLFRLQRPSNVQHGCVPYLAWRPAVLDEREQELLEPLLVVGWGTHVAVLQVLTVQGPTDVQVRVVQRQSIEKDITGIVWMGTEMLMILDSSDTLHVIDPMTWQEYERVECKSAGLLMTDTDIRMEFSSNSSFVACQDTAYLLGVDRVSSIRLVSWSECVDLFIREGRWLDALALNYEFYRGEANVAMWIPKNPAVLHQVTADRLVQALRQLIAEHLRPAGERENESEATSSMAPFSPTALAKIAIEYCVAVARYDELLGDLAPEFTRTGHSSVFLAELEPFILLLRLGKGTNLSEFPVSRHRARSSHRLSRHARVEAIAEALHDTRRTTSVLSRAQSSPYLLQQSTVELRAASHSDRHISAGQALFYAKLHDLSKGGRDRVVIVALNWEHLVICEKHAMTDFQKPLHVVLMGPELTILSAPGNRHIVGLFPPRRSPIFLSFMQRDIFVSTARAFQEGQEGEGVETVQRNMRERRRRQAEALSHETIVRTCSEALEKTTESVATSSADEEECAVEGGDQATHDTAQRRVFPTHNEGSIPEPAIEEGTLVILDPTSACMLSRFVGRLDVSSRDFQQALLRLDEDVLTLFVVRELIKCLPSDETLEHARAFQEYGLLVEAEQFLVDLAEIPRLRLRLHCHCFALEFDPWIADLSAALDSVQLAATNIRGRVLEVLVEIVHAIAPTPAEDECSSVTSALRALEDPALRTTVREVIRSRFPDLGSLRDVWESLHGIEKLPTSITESLEEMKRQLCRLEEEFNNECYSFSGDDAFYTKMTSFYGRALEDVEHIEGRARLAFDELTHSLQRHQLDSVAAVSHLVRTLWISS